ncbi:hypothetical protein MRX96_012065 [Rhipicephalus microplus]
MLPSLRYSSRGPSLHSASLLVGRHMHVRHALTPSARCFRGWRSYSFDRQCARSRTPSWKREARLWTCGGALITWRLAPSPGRAARVLFCPTRLGIGRTLPAGSSQNHPGSRGRDQ